MFLTSVSTDRIAGAGVVTTVILVVTDKKKVRAKIPLKSKEIFSAFSVSKKFKIDEHLVLILQ